MWHDRDRVVLVLWNRLTASLYRNDGVYLCVWDKFDSGTDVMA